jgi:hypothetical protein
VGCHEAADGGRGHNAQLGSGAQLDHRACARDGRFVKLNVLAAGLLVFFFGYLGIRNSCSYHSEMGYVWVFGQWCHWRIFSDGNLTLKGGICSGGIVTHSRCIIIRQQKYKSCYNQKKDVVKTGICGHCTPSKHRKVHLPREASSWAVATCPAI